MTVELNHTIVTAQDRWAAARSLAEILGLPAPSGVGPFAAVQLANGVTLDFAEFGPVTPQHYAFLVDDATVDAVAARLAERDIPTWADPSHQTPGQNTNNGGRGLYWESADGHNLEVLTRP